MGLFKKGSAAGLEMNSHSSGETGEYFGSLEPRLMLAGDVSAAIAGANLVLRGDADDNSIRIVAGETPGSFVVEGVDGTTINGEASVSFDKVKRNIKINLKKGADTLEVEEVDLKGNLQINTGNGDDTVGILASDIGGKLSIRMGNGEAKSVSIEDTEVGKNLSIKDKGGAQTAELNNVNVGGKAQLKFGGGDDILGLFGSTFRKGGVFLMGGGDDQAWVEDNTFSKRSLLHGGRGEDAVTEDLEGLNDVAKGGSLKHFELTLGSAEEEGPFGTDDGDPLPPVA